MEDVLDAVVAKIVETAHPDKVILFGSRSKGGARPESDYDLLVLKHGLSNRRALAHQLYRMLVDIPAAVDILVETPEHLAEYQYSQGFIYAEALRGLVVYER